MIEFVLNDEPIEFILDAEIEPVAPVGDGIFDYTFDYTFE